jgi:hypothetical protein
MNVDNFKQIKKHLVFNSDDDFYFAQIIQRRKENPSIGKDNVVIKSYFVGSIEYFDKKEEEIKQLSKQFNARVYINLSPKSYKKVTLLSLEKMAKVICNEEWKYTKRIYESACGESLSTNRTWIVDVDFKDITKIEKLSKLINECDTEIIDKIETPNGYHLITYPFNQEQFKLKKIVHLDFDVDIHKNNPTVLYY